MLRACLIVTLAACDYTSFADCEVACTDTSGCPDGFTCGREGLCRLAGAAGSCAVGPSCSMLDCDDHDGCTVDTCIEGSPATCKHDPVAVTPGMQTFASTGAIATFTPPACVGQLTIEAFGAQGGDGGTGTGGKGARMKGTFTVPHGAELSILVGEAGTDGSSTGGGGGGSFVWLTTADDMPLIAAGGGGGGVRVSSTETSAGLGGVTTADGTNGVDASTGRGTAGKGAVTPSGINWAAGGAGWSSGGAMGGGSGLSMCTVAKGGATPRNGGAGGTSGGSGTGVQGAGGFGGGGGSQGRCTVVGGGGGGGFSGGGAGVESVAEAFRAGGGGGSFNSGANPDNEPAARIGNGRVVISW